VLADPAAPPPIPVLPGEGRAWTAGWVALLHQPRAADRRPGHTRADVETRARLLNPVRRLAVEGPPSSPPRTTGTQLGSANTAYAYCASCWPPGGG